MPGACCCCCINGWLPLHPTKFKLLQLRTEFIRSRVALLSGVFPRQVASVSMRLIQGLNRTSLSVLEIETLGPRWAVMVNTSCERHSADFYKCMCVKMVGSAANCDKSISKYPPVHHHAMRSRLIADSGLFLMTSHRSEAISQGALQRSFPYLLDDNPPYLRYPS